MSLLKWLPNRLAPLLLACVTGCDLPTTLPSWTTDWELLAVDAEVSTADLLPDGVRLHPNGFAIDSFGTAASIRLGEVCELCTCFDGPVPALDITPNDWPVRLPPGLAEAQLLEGRARLVLVNEIGFDLLDDGQGGRGRLDVELADRFTGDVSDRILLAGAFPPGDSLALEFDLAQLRLHSSLVARVSGHTPGSGGCAVSLTEESGFRARVELLDVVASSVEVLLSDAALALRPRSVELPSPLAHRLRPGEAQLALKIALESRVPTAAEVDLSVAPGVEALFTRAAALHTPLLLPSPTAAAPAFARGIFLLELADVQEADRLHFATHTRITGTRRVQLTGDESLHYRLVVRAEVPIR